MGANFVKSVLENEGGTTEEQFIPCYHGTPLQGNVAPIFAQGLDKARRNCRNGQSFGSGAYFSPKFETAANYAGANGAILLFALLASEAKQPRSHILVAPERCALPLAQVAVC